MKALIYARQSSGKDDFSESVEAQIANCKKLAAKEKLEVIGVYKDLNTSGETYGYLYLFKDKLRYGWQKKEYRSIYSYEQYWRRTC